MEKTKQEVVDEIASLWAPMTNAQKNLLALNTEIKQYTRGDLIYQDQAEPERMMYVVEGKAKIYKDGIAEGCRRQILRIVKPKEFFAYRAYFAHEHYKTSSVAIEPTTIALITPEAIEKLTMKNTNVAMFFIRHLAKVLGQSDARIVNLTQKHIRGRLAEALLALKDEYGQEEGNDTLCLRMSREDLACYSNMTTSNAIRTLSAFADEGLLQVNGRKIKILNEKELSNISMMG